jgi:hypothetical protein
VPAPHKRTTHPGQKRSPFREAPVCGRPPYPSCLRPYLVWDCPSLAFLRSAACSPAPPSHPWTEKSPRRPPPPLPQVLPADTSVRDTALLFARAFAAAWDASIACWKVSGRARPRARAPSIWLGVGAAAPTRHGSNQSSVGGASSASTETGRREVLFMLHQANLGCMHTRCAPPCNPTSSPCRPCCWTARTHAHSSALRAQ